MTTDQTQTTKNAAQIWADAIRKTGIWMSPFADNVAELGRLIIPQMQALADTEYHRGIDEAREVTLSILDEEGWLGRARERIAKRGRAGD